MTTIAFILFAGVLKLLLIVCKFVAKILWATGLWLWCAGYAFYGVWLCLVKGNEILCVLALPVLFLCVVGGVVWGVWRFVRFVRAANKRRAEKRNFELIRAAMAERGISVK